MAKNKDTFVTVTGFKHYYGLAPFRIGRLIRCAKEPENPFDSDAVRAFLPCIGKVGYIANSPDTRAGGTESASQHLRPRTEAFLHPRAVHDLYQGHLPCRARRYERAKPRVRAPVRRGRRYELGLKRLRFALLPQLFRRVGGDECV